MPASFRCQPLLDIRLWPPALRPAALNGSCHRMARCFSCFPAIRLPSRPQVHLGLGAGLDVYSDTALGDMLLIDIQGIPHTDDQAVICLF